MLCPCEKDILPVSALTHRGWRKPTACVSCDAAHCPADMCTHCHLTTPRGTHDVCHACAIALRADVRRGLDAIEEYLRWSEFERWLSQEE